jgi:hypothetical protein
MIRELALVAALTAQQDMVSVDQTHLIGYKNGTVTTAASAQMDACVAAFLDGKEATLSKGETLEVKEALYQTLQRDSCLQEGLIPSTGEKYCKKYGPKENLTAEILQMKSGATGRAIQLFCLTRGQSEPNAEQIRLQSLNGLLHFELNP